MLLIGNKYRFTNHILPMFFFKKQEQFVKMGMDDVKMGRIYGPPGQLIRLCKTIITKVKTTIVADIYRTKENEHHLKHWIIKAT